MINSNTQLAEMVNQANYAAMSYGELVTLNFAYLLAIGDIKPLIQKKRAEEMDAITDEYVAKMNNYMASKDEILFCIEKKQMRMAPYAPDQTHTMDVDDQTPKRDVAENQDKGDSVLALPEHCASTMDDLEDETTVSADAIEAPAKEGTETAKSISLEKSGNSFVEDAVEIMKTLSLPTNVESQEPYHITCDFTCGDNGEFGHSDPYGRNMSKKDLEDYRVAREKFIRLFEKKTVIASSNDYLVYLDGVETYKVSIYHFPEEEGDRRVPTGAPGTCIHTTDEEMKEIKKKTRLLNRAIKMAKEYSFPDKTDVNTPFYDRYHFYAYSANRIEQRGDKFRYYEEASDLSELMPAFETYARLFQEGYVVLSKDNCVAAVSGSTIYLVLFNIPEQKNDEPAKEKKKRNATKKAKPATKKSPTTIEDPIISKAVDMTKTLPLENEAGDSTPYFVQRDFIISGDNEVVPKGRPFVKHIGGDAEVAGLQKRHCKFAKTMKARQIESADDYTAYIWNDGKTLTVYYYNQNAQG